MKAIKTSYKGPTNTGGARIIVTDGDKNRVSIPYPHELNSDDAHRAAAKALCDKMKWGYRMTMGWLGNDAVHVFNEGKS